jgi:hypothetical protein
MLREKGEEVKNEIKFSQVLCPAHETEVNFVSDETEVLK